MSLFQRKSIQISVLWLTLAVLSVVVLGFRLQLSFDLSAFLPQKTNLTHEILLEQLKNGPGSRLMVIGIKGAERNQLADLSNTMKQDLSSKPAFLNVLNGDSTIETLIIPEPVNTYYLLLDDIDFSKTALRQALELRLRDLALGGGSALLDLISKDPFLQTLKVLERLAPVSLVDQMWFAQDGSAVLLAETKAAAVDISAQAQAISAVKETFLDMPGSDSLELEITGVGAFAVELQDTIRSEAKKRTILAVCALLTTLLVVYRKPRYLLLATLPIGMGFLVGLSVLTLLFESVHGITLAFGFTLLGIAIDYPLHLFSHSRQNPGDTALRRIWPTLRIGAISTAIAYLAIALSGSRGLAQLGVFTSTGVIVAVLVTRSWLPFFICSKQDLRIAETGKLKQPSLRYLPTILILLVTLLATHYLVEEDLWDDRLSSLSPVPEKRLASDGLLRSAVGAPDMRYQLVLHSPTLESLLRDNERIDLLLKGAVDDGLLASWQSVTQALPSQSLQQTRKESIPDGALIHVRLSEVLEESPFLMNAFEPFEANVRSSKTLLPLSPGHFKNTPLASWLDSHLVHLGDQWVSLITLTEPKPEELVEYMSAWSPGPELVDLHQSSSDLVHDYRNGAIKTISFASLVIIALLLLDNRRPQSILWIALTVMTALSMTIFIAATWHGGLTIIHLVALILVMGLGLDYALFFSRAETESERRGTRHALMACVITTTLTFGILAGSSIPVLKFLGLTVAVGSAASFLLAFVGSQLFGKERLV